MVINSLTGHLGEVTSVAFSPDGSLLASGSVDGSIKIWQVSTGTCLQTRSGLGCAVDSLAFSPTGPTLASGLDSGAITLWNVNLTNGTLTSLMTLSGHLDMVNALAFSPDGTTLASGSGDTTIMLWQVSTGTNMDTLTGHSSGVQSVAFSPDGQTLASGSADSTIKLWEMSDDSCEQTVSVGWTPVWAVNFSPDGKTLVGGSDDGLALWDVAPPLSAIAVSPTGNTPLVVNTPVTFTAVATGGYNLEYQFWIYNPAANPKWSQLQAYSNSATCVWTPATAGNYMLAATAWDENTGATVSQNIGYDVINAPLTAVTFTTNPVLEQLVNTPVTISATATGGANVQYQFWSYNPAATPAWSPLQAFSGQATCVWTPQTAGSYLLSVTAQDGLTGAEVSQLAWYTISSTPPLSAVTLTASPASPQPINKPITLSAVATGGSNVQYQFWVYEAAATPAWQELQDYSASATCTWKPATPGNYLLSVTARDAGGLAMTNTCWYAVTGANGPLTGVTFTASPASPQPINTQISINANATGGTNVQYQFWLYNPAATPAWSQLQAYSNQASCSWSSATPGDYLISVSARDGIIGNEVSQMAWYNVTDPSLIPLEIGTLPASPQPINTSITLSALATGNVIVKYQFWVYNPAGSPAWSQLQTANTTYPPNSPPGVCVWTPTAPGSYMLSITAIDQVTGNLASQNLWYTITNPGISAVSFTTTPASPQRVNTPITIHASATGGTNVQYQFWVYNAVQTQTWSELQAYSASASCLWTPSMPSNYLLSVSARDGITGAEVSQTSWYSITAMPPP